MQVRSFRARALTGIFAICWSRFCFLAPSQAEGETVMDTSRWVPDERIDRRGQVRLHRRYLVRRAFFEFTVVVASQEMIPTLIRTVGRAILVNGDGVGDDLSDLVVVDPSRCFIYVIDFCCQIRDIGHDDALAT